MMLDYTISYYVTLHYIISYRTVGAARAWTSSTSAHSLSVRPYYHCYYYYYYYYYYCYYNSSIIVTSTINYYYYWPDGSCLVGDF